MTERTDILERSRLIAAQLHELAKANQTELADLDRHYSGKLASIEADTARLRRSRGRWRALSFLLVAAWCVFVYYGG